MTEDECVCIGSSTVSRREKTVGMMSQRHVTEDPRRITVRKRTYAGRISWPAGEIPWQVIIVIAGVHLPGRGELLVVVHHVNAARLGFRLRKRREKHSCQYRDNCNHDQQFDQ